MKLKCTTVLVKFMDKGAPQQEVRAAQVTYAKILEVVRDDKFLVLNFISNLGYVIKQISYALPDVKEYALEGVEPPQAIIPKV